MANNVLEEDVGSHDVSCHRRVLGNSGSFTLEEFCITMEGVE